MLKVFVYASLCLPLTFWRSMAARRVDGSTPQLAPYRSHGPTHTYWE